MVMAVVNIWVVRMAMHERLMGVLVRMWLGRVRAGLVLVPVMLVVPMAMGVDERFVDMFVLVPLGEMQPGAHTHEQSRRQQPRR